MRPVPALLVAALLGGCRIAASRAWNLNEIHDERTHHRYSGAIESDMEYLFRHEIGSYVAETGANFVSKSAVAIPDPAEACLENLLELQDHSDKDAKVAAMKVEWEARLATADPWKLTRERAVLGLGRAGRRLKAGVPAELPEGSAPAGPEAVGEALAGLLHAARPVLDRKSGASETERLDLDSACQVVRGLVLDIDGARRLLHATADLADSASDREPTAAPLRELSLELQRRCVRQGLAHGLKDREPIVRAAALDAAVRSAGPEVLDPILAQLSHEPAPEVLVRAMDLVREVGLPTSMPPGTNATPEQAQRARLAAIYDLLDRPEGVVRVSAMRALERVAGTKLHSLREEDWQTWWVSLREKPGP